MKIEKLSFCNKTDSQSKKINFGSAADITFEYAIKKHSRFLPADIIKKAPWLLQKGFGNQPLWKVHNEVYKDLFEANNLGSLISLILKIFKLLPATVQKQ